MSILFSLFMCSFCVFSDWEKPVLINMTWIHAAKHIVSSFECRKWGSVWKLRKTNELWKCQESPLCADISVTIWTKWDFDMFVCDRSNSHNLRHWSAMPHRTGLSFLFLFQRQPQRNRFSSFKVAMELLLTYCRLKKYLILHCNFQANCYQFLWSGDPSWLWHFERIW